MDDPDFIDPSELRARGNDAQAIPSRPRIVRRRAVLTMVGCKLVPAVAPGGIRVPK